MKEVIFDYRKLSGRITEKGFTQKGFAEELDMAPSTLSLKLNNKFPFSQQEISKALDILEIARGDVGIYFFTLKV